MHIGFQRNTSETRRELGRPLFNGKLNLSAGHHQKTSLIHPPTLASAGRKSTRFAGWDDADIMALSVKTGQTKTLLHGGSFPRYIPLSGPPVQPRVTWFTFAKGFFLASRSMRTVD